MSGAAISRHLKVLREAGLVQQRVHGTQRMYSIQPDGLRAIAEWTISKRQFWETSLDRLGDIHGKGKLMADLKLEREFPTSPETLFSWISDGEKLLQWWGPEGVHVPEHDLDFSRTWAVVFGYEKRRKVKRSKSQAMSPMSIRQIRLGSPGPGMTIRISAAPESHVTFSVAATENWGAPCSGSPRIGRCRGIAANHELWAGHRRCANSRRNFK